MPSRAPSAPGNPAARQISLAFGMIADTLEWTHSDYQALIVRLESTGKASLSLTLDDVLTAILAQQHSGSASCAGRAN